MNILVLNGSLHADGNAAAMVKAFVEGASENGHTITVVDVCKKKLQCAINRIYALDKPKNLKKAALILSSGSDHVYCGAIYEYQNSFLNYLKLKDMGMYSAFGKWNKSEEKLDELREFGRSL